MNSLVISQVIMYSLFFFLFGGGGCWGVGGKLKEYCHPDLGFYVCIM